MIPILYQTITEGTVPSNYGIGPLTDCISCKVTEERNGSYELVMTYGIDGIHASDIQYGRFIKAKPNFTDDPQLFRIYKVGKTINGIFTVKAQHISYDLSGKLINSGTASGVIAACALLQAQAGAFTINTDKTTSAAFKITAPSSVRSWFGGKEGSLLDVYGGEWKYDNYTASLKNARGSDRGVQIRYGKNLTQLSQEIDMSNLVTGIVPYYVDMDGNVTAGAKVSTGLTLDVPRDMAIDFSQDVNPDSGTAITTQLANLANAYIANNNLTNAINSITLDFVQSGELTERVDLCDTVHIYFEALGISASAKCVTTVWDVLEGRYTSTTFGTARASIADTIANTSKQVEKAVNRSSMSEAINHATELITGNLGGYVVFHDSDGDDYPDEILIMDTADITTATKVWRWNKNGLGYSSTGYSGSYSTAITADGKIVADFIKTGALNASLITTGVLNADLIKAGTIQDTGNNSSINLTTGEAILKNIKAKLALILVDANGVERGQMKYTIQTGAAIFLREPNNQATVAITAGTSNDASMSLLRSNGTSGVDIEIDNSEGGRAFFANSSNKYGITLKADTGYGGSVAVNNDNGNKRGELYNSANGGCLDLYNSLGNVAFEAYTYHDDCFVYIKDSEGHNKISLNGDLGQITCVHVNETSSRKVKKNIKPIEDSEKILELEAVSFDYQREHWGTDQRGFIAEDVAKVLPNLVTEETEDRYASLNYIGMIPYLQDVIKKQEQRIKALEDKLAQLGG